MGFPYLGAAAGSISARVLGIDSLDHDLPILVKGRRRAHEAQALLGHSGIVVLLDILHEEGQMARTQVVTVDLALGAGGVDVLDKLKILAITHIQKSYLEMSVIETHYSLGKLVVYFQMHQGL